MAKRMLIDATQPEETRVAVLDGNRLDELDFEIASKKQLKGNIYLAKITRVEPSLQAAFVDYGGNRHGFLAFSEIHPDYYRIPVADREKLLELERQLEAEEAAIVEAEVEAEAVAEGLLPPPAIPVAAAPNGEMMATPVDAPAPITAIEPTAQPAEIQPIEAIAPLPAPTEVPLGQEPEGDLNSDAPNALPANLLPPESAPEVGEDGEIISPEDAAAAAAAEELGDDDAEHRRLSRRRAAILRQYKIQEVIKRNQIVLIQVVKEERGNKGAALTTYLSLAGRYCVLMPNTGRGGGVSRKITNPEDRRRMKSLIDQLTVPEGMSVILRTAGMERSHQDIQRDLDTIVRLWDGIREHTLQATAPALVHEEANLIRRAIRDLYSRDVAKIEVEGDAGFRMAKDFMRSMVPAAARKVQHYRDPAVPLFVRHRLETQIEALYNTTVTLKSGGYIVINPTEALVAIDVNSGRSTRERNIEETALRTNLEAAEEVARQLRLRDLAGLIVVDFIDMEDPRHNAQVERRMREAMKGDRARVQIGRISLFGLLELSRQRLHPSLVETNFSACPHCNGSGNIRNTESAARHILRSVEDEGLQQKASELAVNVASEVSLYILNHKRAALADIERRYGIKVFIHGDDDLKVSEFKIERLKARLPGEFAFPEAPPQEIDPLDASLPTEEEEEIPAAERHAEGAEDGGEGSDENGGRRSRFGRGRGRTRGSRGPRTERGENPAVAADGEQPVVDGELQPAGLSHEGQIIQNGEGTGEEGGNGERRRRGRRGGRGRYRGERPAGAGPYPTDMPQPVMGFDDQPILTSADLPLPADGSAVDGNTVPAEGAPRDGNREGRGPRRSRGGRGRGPRNGERGPRPQGDNPQGERTERPQGDRPQGERGERRPREDRRPRDGNRHQGEGSQPSNPNVQMPASDIRIVSEFRGRDPQPGSISSAPVTVNPPSDKPKSGWWKRLIGSGSE